MLAGQEVSGILVGKLKFIHEKFDLIVSVAIAAQAVHFSSTMDRELQLMLMDGVD